MAAKKGAGLEELIRQYFLRQGYFAIRSVPLRFEGEEVTDIDVWLYGRQAASGRVRAIVDAKDKRSPKALERVLWTKGLQAIVGADRAIVVTTDKNPRIAKFARENRVSVINKHLIDRIRASDIANEPRLSLEEFEAHIGRNLNQKQDGDWLRQIADAKSSLATTAGFPAFNQAIRGFHFFAQRIDTRPLYRDQATRCALLCASIAAVALDTAIERIAFEEQAVRTQAILDGVTFGDAGDGRTQRSIKNVLALISESMENGRAIAVQAEQRLNSRFESLRGDIIAEYFGRENNAHQLFQAARELESKAHAPLATGNGFSLEAKAVLGVFADFVEVKRSTLFSAGETAAPPAGLEDVGSPIEQRLL